MRNKIFISAALIGLIAAGCNSSKVSVQSQNASTAQLPPIDPSKIQTVNIDITANGFSPADVTIHRGDSVQFTNKDTDQHWPASNPHPTHTDYPGFDALHGLAQGEKYTFQFLKLGTWGYHDHLNPFNGGKVTVLPQQ